MVYIVYDHPATFAIPQTKVPMPPEIRLVDRFTESDLLNERGVLFVVPLVELDGGGPSNTPFLAGVCYPGGRGDKLEMQSIFWHHGRARWALSDGSLPLSQSLQFGCLPDLVRDFEAAHQVELPQIKIIEAGVGIYAAKTRHLNSADNPYRLLPGRYQTVGKLGKRREFDVRDTGFIQFIGDDDHPEHNLYEARLVLTLADWKSLRQVQVASKKVTP